MCFIWRTPFFRRRKSISTGGGGSFHFNIAIGGGRESISTGVGVHFSRREYTSIGGGGAFQ